MKKYENEKITLSKKDFSFVCPLKTDDMTVVEGGHFCTECEKKVHDVSKMTQEEYKTLVVGTDNVCVSFKKVATMSLALSLAACATPKKTNPLLLGKIAPQSTCNVDVNKTIDKNETIKIKYKQTFELMGDVMEVEALAGVPIMPIKKTKKIIKEK